MPGIERAWLRGEPRGVRHPLCGKRHAPGAAARPARPTSRCGASKRASPAERRRRIPHPRILEVENGPEKRVDMARRPRRSDRRQPGSGVRAAARSECAFQGVCLQRVEIQGHPGRGGTRHGTRGADARTRLRGGVETRPRDGRSDTPGTERTAVDRNAARPERSPAARFAIRQAKPYSWSTRVHRRGGPGQRQKETIP